jgi:hypothetical protein
MRKQLCTVGIAVAAMLSTVSGTRADVIYSYATDVTNTADASGAATINLYLVETLNTNNNNGKISPSVIPSTGMFGGGVALNVVGGPGTVSSVAGNTNPVSAGGFGTGYSGDANNVNKTGTQGAIIIGVNFLTTGPTLSNVSSSSTQTVNQLLLGTATFTGVTANTTIAITSFNNAPAGSFGNNNGNGNTVTQSDPTFGPIDLDITNNTPNGGPPPIYTGADDTSGQNNLFTIQAAAVPEPSSMLLCGMLLVGGAYGAYRRRKNQPATVEAVV